MKTGIHPAYHQITVSCACGHSFVTGSTHSENIRVEICSHCHPLYTGKSKLVDTAGRLERFKLRLEKTRAHQDTAKARSDAQKAKAATKTEA